MRCSVASQFTNDEIRDVLKAAGSDVSPRNNLKRWLKYAAPRAEWSKRTVNGKQRPGYLNVDRIDLEPPVHA